jgi:hypothetical protein
MVVDTERICSESRIRPSDCGKYLLFRGRLHRDPGNRDLKILKKQ